MTSVIILTGASGSGKSEIIRILKEIGKEEKFKKKFLPTVIQKYTTREFRNTELEKIRNHMYTELDVKPVFGKDNIVTDNKGNCMDEEEQTKVRMRMFSELKCDMVYEQYGNRYGIYISELYEKIKCGESPIIILNDVRAVEDIKTFLGDKCISLFVFRKSPDISDYIRIGEERNSNFQDQLTRFNKANSIYRIYIENIHLFDKLILNVQDGFESIYEILYQFVDELCSSSYKNRFKGGNINDKL